MKKKISFLLLVGFLVLVIAGRNFYRYHIAKDYQIYVFTECNPAEYSCFEADQETASPMFQSKPYKKVELAAVNAPSCLGEHTCSDFACTNTTVDCKIIYCSEDTKEEGEVCSGPNQ